MGCFNFVTFIKTCEHIERCKSRNLLLLLLFNKGQNFVHPVPAWLTTVSSPVVIIMSDIANCHRNLALVLQNLKTAYYKSIDNE
jgi:GTP:adenosylcobinamide-phosphate guanylyltransferase